LNATVELTMLSPIGQGRQGERRCEPDRRCNTSVNHLVGRPGPAAAPIPRCESQVRPVARVLQPPTSLRSCRLHVSHGSGVVAWTSMAVSSMGFASLACVPRSCGRERTAIRLSHLGVNRAGACNNGPLRGPRLGPARELTGAARGAQGAGCISA